MTKKRNYHLKCSVCGKLTAGRAPVYYGRTINDDFYYPRKHWIKGNICEGSFKEAIYVADRDAK